jgi:hypothetical protein
LLLCSSYLPLGVPNWAVIYINTAPQSGASEGNGGDSGDGRKKKNRKEDKRQKGLAQNYCY